MKVDLHCHTNHSPDCWISPAERVEEAIGVGLHCLAITDHNTLGGAFEAREYAGDRLRIIVGEEISTAQGELLGLFLEETIPLNLDIWTTAQQIKQQGGLVYLPHPFSILAWDRVKGPDRRRIEDLVDIVEVVNSRNFLPRNDTTAWAYGAALNKMLAASSDAHTGRELGKVYLEMEPFDGPQDFHAKLQSAKAHILSRANPFWTALSVAYLYPNKWYRSFKQRMRDGLG